MAVTNVVGLLPAAGGATRIMGLPKYLLPCPGGFLLERLACAMTNAGIKDVYIAANADNARLLERYAPSFAITYLVNSQSMRASLLGAARWNADRPALFAMPDTYITDLDIFTRLLDALDSADIAIGLWRTRPDQRPHLGMCAIDDAFNVLRVDNKPAQTTLELAWGAMAWRVPFWYLIDRNPGDMHDCLNEAIRGGLVVKGVMAMGAYWDCGTPEEYFKLCSTWNGRHK